MDAAVDHIWQSTLVAGAAGALTLVFATNGAAVRYWIWFAASMKFLVPFAVVGAATARLAEIVAVPLDGGGQAAQALTVMFQSAALPSGTGDHAAIFASVWLLGAVTVAGWWTAQWWRVTTMARGAETIGGGPVHDALRRAELALGLRRPTMLGLSQGTLEPGVIGIRRPMLLWPAHLSVLDDREVETIVAHEAAHISRRDNACASAHVLVSTLFWFHPMVWWIGARLVDERERACDERVLALGESPAIYAASILKTCRLCVSSPLPTVSGVTGGNLKHRIARIMASQPSAALGFGKKVLLAGAALALGAATIAAGAPQDANRQPERPGRNVTTPRLIRDVKPVYPARAMEEKIEGEVLLECVVKADGTVGNIKIVKALHPDLDQAAKDAAAQWVFEPGTKDGKPVDVLVAITMAFTLKE